MLLTLVLASVQACEESVKNKAAACAALFFKRALVLKRFPPLSPDCVVTL